jgi:hypothetical protein
VCQVQFFDPGKPVVQKITKSIVGNGENDTKQKGMSKQLHMIFLFDNRRRRRVYSCFALACCWTSSARFDVTARGGVAGITLGDGSGTEEDGVAIGITTGETIEATTVAPGSVVSDRV